MAVVWARQKSSREYSETDTAARKGQRVYLVRCNALDDDPDVAAAACPAIGDSWSVAVPGLVVTERSARETERGEDFVLYEVVLNYATATQDPAEGGSGEPNPLDRLPEVSLEFEAFEETIYEARVSPPTFVSAADGAEAAPTGWRWGKAICNAAGRDFEAQPTHTYYDPVVTIVRNEGVLPWDTAIQYAGAVNSDEFTINYRGTVYTVEPGQAKLLPPTSQSGYENGVRFERVTWKLALRADGWKIKIKNAGLEALDSGDLPARPIRDANGDPVQKAVPLDIEGNAAEGGPVLFAAFVDYAELAFGDLDLDKSWNEAHGS